MKQNFKRDSCGSHFAITILVYSVLFFTIGGCRRINDDSQIEKFSAADAENIIRELASSYSETVGEAKREGMVFETVRIFGSDPIIGILEPLTRSPTIWNKMSLNLGDCPLNSEIAETLINVENLHSLTCPYVTKSAWNKIASAQDLKEIYVSNMKSIDSILQGTPVKFQVDALGIHGSVGVSDNIERLVQQFSKVTWMSLLGTDIKDSDLEAVSRLSQLENLNLNGTSITEEGLKRLFPCKSLRYVSTDVEVKDNPQFTDAPFQIN